MTWAESEMLGTENNQSSRILNITIIFRRYKNPGWLKWGYCRERGFECL